MRWMLALLAVACAAGPAVATDGSARPGAYTLLDGFEDNSGGWGAELGPDPTVRRSRSAAFDGRWSLEVTLSNQRVDMVRATWGTDVSHLRFSPDTRIRFRILGSKAGGPAHGGLILRESGGAADGTDAQWMAPIPGSVYQRRGWSLVELPPLREWTQPDWSVDADGKLDTARIGRMVFVAQHEAAGGARPFAFHMDALEASDVAPRTGTKTLAGVETSPGPVRPALRGFVGRRRAHPAQVTFDNISGWTATAYGEMAVRFVRSPEEPLFGKPTGKLTYSSSDGTGRIVLIPPRPIALPARWNAVQAWVFGNNWDWMPDPTTPQVEIVLLVRDRTGETHRLPTGRVNWKFWGLLHRTVPAAPAADPGRSYQGGDRNGRLDGPAAFVGLEIRNCGNKAPRTLYFDSVAFYTEALPRVAFAPQPPLPIPTRRDTIVPPPLSPVRLIVRRTGRSFVFASSNAHGEVGYVYTPNTGTLDDLEVRCGRSRFRPAVGCGPVWLVDGQAVEPDRRDVRRTLLSAVLAGDTLRTRWRWSLGPRSVEVVLSLRAVGRSLVHSWSCSRPEMAGLRLGRASGLAAGRYIPIPFYSLMGAGGAGAVADVDAFATHLPDWYATNASWFEGRALLETPAEVAYAGSVTYRPLTDGMRVPLNERCVLTVSPRFEEVLPSIPNPPSPMTAVLRSHMYTHLGGTAPNRFETWLARFREYKAYGIDNLIVTQHEDSWTEGGDVGQGPQEYTMTAEGPPDAGGDAGIRRYYTAMRALGYRVGPYNNYCDYSPLGKSWDEAYVTRTPENEWQRAWPPTFSIKPSKAVEMSALYGPRQVAKFGVNATYCDVHTAVAPWVYVDYQAGLPGAGKLRTTFEAYARILAMQRRTYGTPCFSEGSHHAFYAGLIDGSYGQMGLPDPPKQPLLLDFDLLRLHPQGADLSMLPGEAWSAGLYHTMATTIAYGHAGYFPVSDPADSLRYYHLMGALQRRMIQEPVVDIGYWDGSRFQQVSEALITGANERGTVRVRYRNGLTVWVNRSDAEKWEVPAGQGIVLTPSSWAATGPDGFLTYCTEAEGRRIGFVRDDALRFADGGGKEHDFGGLVTAGMVVVRGAPGAAEVIFGTPYPLRADAALLGRGAAFTVHDASGAQIGRAAVAAEPGGMMLLQPAPGAIRYRPAR